MRRIRRIAARKPTGSLSASSAIRRVCRPEQACRPDNDRLRIALRRSPERHHRFPGRCALRPATPASMPTLCEPRLASSRSWRRTGLTGFTSTRCGARLGTTLQQHLQLLRRRRRRAIRRMPVTLPPGRRELFTTPAGHRVAGGRHDDRHRRRRLLGAQCRLATDAGRSHPPSGAPRSAANVRQPLEHRLRRCGTQSTRLRAFDVAEARAVPRRASPIEARPRHSEPRRWHSGDGANALDPFGLLLRTQRPSGGVARTQAVASNCVAPPHSITRSARSST